MPNFVKDNNDVLIVIADGIFSHAYGRCNVYIVDIDDHAEEEKLGAMYNPSTDLQERVGLADIDRKFGTTFNDDADSCIECGMLLDRCTCDFDIMQYESEELI